jgi:diguanylate cyclase (GGDEF)-like protein
MAFSGRLTKPLRDLTEVAERVGEGDYDCSLDYDGKDEVGVLTRTFNKLVAHLKVYIGDLNDLAYADALTSLRNKGAFNYHIENLQAQMNERKGDVAFAVCAFDCNSLKEINDQYGHDKGDIHLQDTAQIICDVFDHSPVFRIGGDEFVAVLQGVDYEHRDELVKLFDDTCAERRETEKDRWKQMDVARGLATYDPEEDTTVNDVVRRADKLMYENKWLVKGMKAQQD